MGKLVAGGSGVDKVERVVVETTGTAVRIVDRTTGWGRIAAHMNVGRE